MLRFRDPNSSPPGGRYVYVQQETKQEFHALNLRKLGEITKAARIANDIPIGINFNREIEDGTCRKILELYPDFTGVEEDNGSQIKSSWNLNDVVQWTATMADWAKKGFKFVPQEQANERAEICAKCPKNIDVAGCWTCGGVSKAVGLIRGNHNTPYDDQLRVCGACGCVLKVLCHLPIDTIAKSHTLDMPYASVCWLRDELAGLPK